MARNKFDGVTVIVKAHGAAPYYFSVGCEYKGARYHYWTSTNRVASNFTMYKNPPLDTKHQSPEDYRTRKLKRTSRPMSELFHYMNSTAHRLALFDAAVKEKDTEESVREANRREMVRRDRLERISCELADKAAEILRFVDSGVMYPAVFDLEPLRQLLTRAGYWET